MLRSALLFAILAIASLTNGLHFYLRDGEQQCFLEELPKGFLVTGHYKTEEWRDAEKRYIENPGITVSMTADDNDALHRVMNQKGSHQGKFSFTAGNAGEHTICVQAHGAQAGGWLTSSIVKFTLDIGIGEADDGGRAAIEKIKDISEKIRILNAQLEEIKVEQKYQRERELEFDAATSSIRRRVIYWAFVQLAIVGAVCFWQLRHLRRFFEAKKLV
ncbi:emp24p/erv25p- protein [Coemansia sp. RSA 2523]|nr:emp24p/erv25p- protein [Coemansia sp. RSA 1591]KAJ1762930.1 emp24p/erv25p- protein [Coemansia sp. RSA 1752]KAJ1766495.1 emp24p/erv25p- protein [Coemansia sp. RSA 1824]KAJ1789182.1 emp24p/erv25p- protein [Coemansia sp. RSA 2167]KAJ1789207.1 emp24p/erv25p- protein [Coemansia sp. RSA 1938]KAJ1802510.1 emp24p/erv25p- protein [Coemansia sp. RSA 2523]KAJ2111136.1 emp24p/erv25p- protein [Coemansia sp. RSA 921]KAJ2162046.1 emp24p/erv25p- protein [Coemansia sp. RSA 562]KAJ2182571.1 emp24p/erv25p-